MIVLETLTGEFHLSSTTTDNPPKCRDSPAKRHETIAPSRLWILPAGLFFILAMIGVVLPGLPTTPFLLLTTYCLARSYPKLNDRLLKSKLFGPILTDWQHRGGIRNHIRTKAIVLVLVGVALTLWIAQVTMPVKWTIALVATVGIGVVLSLPQARDDEDTP